MLRRDAIAPNPILAIWLFFGLLLHGAWDVRDWFIGTLRKACGENVRYEKAETILRIALGMQGTLAALPRRVRFPRQHSRPDRRRALQCADGRRRWQAPNLSTACGRQRRLRRWRGLSCVGALRVLSSRFLLTLPLGARLGRRLE